MENSSVFVIKELKRFLATGEDGLGVSRLESCFSLSLLLHMVFQEHKDSRGLRRLVLHFPGNVVFSPDVCAF